MCPRCLKRTPLCICAEIQPLSTKTQVLILQHPQELDQDLGTARLTHLTLSNSVLKTGLSWPNLHAAAGARAVPSDWAVLHVPGPKNQIANPLPPQKSHQDQLIVLDRRGNPISPPPEVKGIIVLDGSWSQAKALWWRNPWLLKLKRLVIIPSTPSLYGRRRKEPRRECLSTLEAISTALMILEGASKPKDQLLILFSELLKRYDRIGKIN